MSGVPIFPPGTDRPGARSPDAVQQKKNLQKNTENLQKNKKNTKETEKNNGREKEKNILQKISDSLNSFPPHKEQISYPRSRKVPITINTSPALLLSSPASSKRKLVDTPITPTILSRLSGSLSVQANDIVSQFGKRRHSLTCINCSNLGCISITSLRHDSDEDEDDEVDENLHLEFQCTLCNSTQPLSHVQQELGITTKKLKMTKPQPDSSISTPLHGTPASMVSPEDMTHSNNYLRLKTSLLCLHCEAQGSIIKFGFTKSMPPRPRFKCNKCTTILTMDQVLTMMDNLESVTPTAQSLEEDIIIPDTQPRASSPDLPSYMDFPPHHSSPEQPHSDTINYLLDSVKKLTDQAAANQEKFDYITTLIEQNEQLKKELAQAQKNNETQKTEIAQLKNMLKEQKNKNMNNNIIQNNEKNTETNINNMNQNTDIDTNMPNTNLTDSSFPPLSANTAPTFAQQVQQAPKKPKYKYAPGQFRSNKPTTESLALAAKTFNDSQLEPTADYKYVYFPCNKRMKPSLIRYKLTLLGIDNLRILDAHCPDWKVIALLIHTNYETELMQKFATAHIHPVIYDYMDPTHLRDQRLSSLTQEEKVQKLEQIFKNNLMRSLSFMRYPLSHSVAKFFHRKEILTTIELQSFFKTSKEKQITDAFPTTPQASQQEALQSPPAASDTTSAL